MQWHSFEQKTEKSDKWGIVAQKRFVLEIIA